MTDLRTLDFSCLLTLDALYEERSVTLAAQRLSVTQPTVSGTLARLRHLFGDPLFVRARGAMIPTPRAEVLASRVKRLLEDGEALLEERPFDPANAEMTARLSANDYSLHVVVLPLLRRLRAEAPNLKLAVVPFEVAALGGKLADREIDMAITVPEMAPADFPSRFLFSDRYVAIVRRQHPVSGETIALDDFCALDHVLVSPTGGAFEGVVDRALREIGRKRRVMISVPSFRVVPEILQIGDLVAVVPERLIADDDPRVRTLSLPFAVAGPDAILVWHSRLQDDRGFRWLREQIKLAGRLDARAPVAPTAK